MGIEYGESRRRSSASTPSARWRRPAPGSRTSDPTTSRERLGLQLAEMDADEERTGLGRMLMFSDCTRYASNRLLIHDLLQRHPEILEIPIEHR